MKQLLLLFVVGATAACTLQVNQGGECCCQFDEPVTVPDASARWEDADAGWYGGTGGGAGGWRRPNVMLLVDTSGSMSEPIAGACQASCPDAGCGPGCETRLSALQTGVSHFATHFGTQLNLGLTSFPAGPTCEPSVAPLVPIPANDVEASSPAHLAAITQQLAVLSARGGTPTGPSLRSLAASPLLTDPAEGRAGFVVLITDGLPNCNPANLRTCGDATVCRYTLSSCQGQFCTLGCLDDQGAVAAIQALQAAHVRVAVVGLGAGTLTGDAPETLNAMAEAGGLALMCPGRTDAECGPGNHCDTSTFRCARRFRHAADATELAAVLAAIGDGMLPPGP